MYINRNILRQVSQDVLMEARGIEPRSRGTSVPASTCVACRFPVHTRGLHRVRRSGLRLAGFRNDYRPVFLAGAAAEAGRVVSPVLKFPRSRFASEPVPLGLSYRNGSRSYREGVLRFSS